MSDEDYERPTKPIEPLHKIEKITLELDETTSAADFFQSIYKVLNSIKPGKKIRATVFVQFEDVEESE